MTSIKNNNINLQVAVNRINEGISRGGYFIMSRPFGWMYYEGGKKLYELFPEEDPFRKDVDNIIYIANRYKNDFEYCRNGSDLINAFEMLSMKIKVARALNAESFLKKYSELL